MKMFRMLSVVLLAFTLVSCAAIKQKLEGLGTSGTTFNLVMDKGKSGLETKEKVYKVVKSMVGPSNTVIVYDASGSMHYETPVGDDSAKKSQKRYELAYQGLTKVAEIFDQNDKVWLLVFGTKVPYELSEGRSLKDINFEKAFRTHSDIVQVYGEKDAGYNREKFMSAIRFLKSGKAYIGDTPIGYSVVKATALLESKPNAKIVLITDGQETSPVLAKAIAGKKSQEKKLKAKYPDYNDILISASDALERAVQKKIHFTPILCGLKSITKNRTTTDKEVAETRAFYENLAHETGSAALEASSSEGLASAVMDAEAASLTYEIFKGDLPEQKIAEGKAGVPLNLDPGTYRLVVNTVPRIETEITVKEHTANVYVLKSAEGGAMKVVPSE
ncbi:MAG: hypothetical protein BWK80_09060 [Desulfobacteraceae bacterium IS3]|nr:MAG: hypothetical protein BWK80_09060 [Desulfobacteraceae bacterium IS3]